MGNYKVGMFSIFLQTLDCFVLKGYRETIHKYPLR